MEEKGKNLLYRLASPLRETFGLSWGMALAAVLLTLTILLAAVFWFFYSAPPHTLIITSGPPGSMYETNALRYQSIITNIDPHMKLVVLPSKGSFENLERLENPQAKVNVGFVQGGVTNSQSATNNGKLVSLGSISYEPLWVFYHSTTPVALLSEFKGKRLAVGPMGSGTRSLAMALLGLNGIGATNSTLLEWDSAEAAKGLIDGAADVVFLMGDSASIQTVRSLLQSPGIQMYDFKQADGYARRITYLNKLVLPQGSIDFGKNIPAHDVNLVAPTVELLARSDLHPALSDMLLDAAKKVHSPASLLKRKGEFPAPLEHDFPISPDATRYYKTGRSFLYRTLGFTLGSLVSRILVAFVPAMVLLIPALRIIPAAYKWRIRLLLYRRYRAMLALERDVQQGPLSPSRHEELQAQLNEIEESVNTMKVPASFADQFYALRTYIVFVRNQLAKAIAAQ